MDDSDTQETLNEILKTLKRIENLLVIQIEEDKISQNISEVESSKKDHSPPLDVVELINVLSKNDEHLIPTIKALLSSKDGGSAQDIASITKRSRSRENQHLNKLVELGYVQKRREGREIRFFLSH